NGNGRSIAWAISFLHECESPLFSIAVYDRYAGRTAPQRGAPRNNIHDTGAIRLQQFKVARLGFNSVDASFGVCRGKVQRRYADICSRVDDELWLKFLMNRILVRAEHL